MLLVKMDWKMLELDRIGKLVWNLWNLYKQDFHGNSCPDLGVILDSDGIGCATDVTETSLQNHSFGGRRGQTLCWLKSPYHLQFAK